MGLAEPALCADVRSWASSGFTTVPTVTVPNHISDDVQVRSVELMFDGVVVLKDLSYPYDLTAALPKIADTGNQVVLQVRATDTGGNVTLSDPIVIDLLKDRPRDARRVQRENTQSAEAEMADR